MHIISSIIGQSLQVRSLVSPPGASLHVEESQGASSKFTQKQSVYPLSNAGGLKWMSGQPYARSTPLETASWQLPSPSSCLIILHLIRQDIFIAKFPEISS